MHLLLDQIIEISLQELSSDEHVRKWYAKERDWVSYYTHRFLLRHVSASGPIRDPAQVGIEVAVAQPAGFPKKSVCRDLVIWNNAGDTCWDSHFLPTHQPMAILEWKVHRPKRKNRKVDHERNWLRKYCAEYPQVAGYAIEVDGRLSVTSISCTRFQGITESANWFQRDCLG